MQSDTGVYENVSFHDQLPAYGVRYDTVVDPTRSLQDMNDASLEHFFSRPIKIVEQEWVTDTVLNFDFNPWSLYFNNVRVVNRISNFNLLRATLKLKVVVNGNGFHYGRAFLAYRPLQQFNELAINNTTLTANTKYTQYPHIKLNPTTSTGGEMTLPFFWYKNYLSIPESEWSEMGTCIIRTFNALRHANGALDKCTVSVFAWAENVQLSVLTSVDTSTIQPQMMQTQMGEIDEANQKGIVSGPATAVSKFAAHLVKVPYIGPFATATEIGAGAVAKIAKMFGYCRPPVTKVPEPYRPVPISSLALTNAPDVTQRLTIDDKQELTIDPAIAGVKSLDQMNIREIASREAYLTTFSWGLGDPPELLLWNARVDPCLWSQRTPAGGTQYFFPPSCMAALPFEYWKGSMKFRFQVVSSTFHKGRLRIVYDPNFLDSNEYNVNYMKIVDVANENDFTIEIGCGQDLQFLRHARPGSDSITEMYGSTAFTGKALFGNGVLAVYVVNELTTPNTNVINDVEVNVFVSMGDDFEVAAPDDYFAKFVVAPLDVPAMAAQAPEVMDVQMSGYGMVPEASGAAEPDAPYHLNTYKLGPPAADHPHLNKVFFGEAIGSFRTMLKRYSLWSCIGKLDFDPTFTSGRYSMFPYFRGSVALAVDTTTAGGSYNYCNTLMLHWVMIAFSGWRGSTRWKFVPRGAQNRGDRVLVQRTPLAQTSPAYTYFQDLLPNYATRIAARRSVVFDDTGGSPNATKPFYGANGSAVTINSVNGVMEFEIPYYSNYRFVPGKPVALTGVQGFVPAWDYRAEFASINDAQSDNAVYDIYCAAGEDFQTYFFTGLPPMYFEDAPPA